MNTSKDDWLLAKIDWSKDQDISKEDVMDYCRMMINYHQGRVDEFINILNKLGEIK